MSTYMIISPRDFINSIQPLVRQKRTRGFDLVIKPVEDFGAPPSPTAMRAFVLGARPAYLLLVGDHDRTPSCRYQDKYDSDNLLGMEDDDVFPQVQIGRLSSNDANSLGAICQALVDYPADPGMNWKRRAILCGWCPRARCDADPDDGGWRSVEEIGSYYDVLPIFANDNLTNDEQRQVWATANNRVSTLQEAINAGAAVVRYLGHGDWNCWTNVAQPYEFFTTNHVGQLAVGNRLPLVISAACITGDIQRNSLAEAFQVQLKAVGVLAADVTSDTWWNERFVPRVFREIVTKRTRRVGDIILGAMRQLHDDYPTSAGPSSVFAEMSRVYRYLGDPDTILAAPEDDGINECRQVAVEVTVRSDGSVRSKPASIDMGKSVRRAWATISGIEGNGPIPPLISRLKIGASVSRTAVTVEASSSIVTGAAPLPAWKGTVLATVLVVL